MEKLKDIFLTKYYSIRNIKFSLEELFCVSIICFLSILLWQNFAALLGTAVWHVDALYYLESYHSRLVYEGRWIIFIFFHVLKSLNPYIMIALSWLCIGFFGYRVAKDFMGDDLFAVIFALALLQIHPIYAYIHWPVTPFPTYLFLAISPLLKKVLNKRTFFICMGVLFFGVYFNFYDLMPLLFLSEIKDRKSFIQIMLLWITGFIIGYLVSEGMVFLMAGTFIQLDRFRQPHQIKTFVDIFRNAGIEYRYLGIGIKGFFARHSVKIVFGCAIAFIALFMKKHQEDRKIIAYKLLLLSAIAMSFYIQLIPVGIKVDPRATSPLYYALIAVILCCYTKTFRSIVVMGLCIVAFAFWNDNINDLFCFREITNTWQTELKSVSPVPTLHKGIRVYLKRDSGTVARSAQIVCHAINKNFKYDTPLERVSQWIPVAKSIGFEQVKLYNEELPAKFAKFSPHGLYRYGYEDGYLYLTIDKKYLEQFTD